MALNPVYLIVKVEQHLTPVKTLTSIKGLQIKCFTQTLSKAKHAYVIGPYAYYHKQSKPGMLVEIILTESQVPIVTKDI